MRLIFEFQCIQEFQQFKIMNQNSRNRKPIITLFDFASNKGKQRSRLQQKNESIQAASSLKSSSKWTYGLDTLIHFNDSMNLSSIKSNYSKNTNQTKPISRYDQLLAQAKEDVQKLKGRRIQSEIEWKKTRLENQEDQRNQSIAESQVTPYDLTESHIPKLPQNKLKRNQVEDHFLEQIRQQITKSNVVKMAQVIKKIFVSKLLSELKLVDQIINLQLQRNRNIIKQVFIEWKKLMGSAQERESIRMAIVARIKKRRNSKDAEQYIQGILNN